MDTAGKLCDTKTTHITLRYYVVNNRHGTECVSNLPTSQKTRCCDKVGMRICVTSLCDQGLLKSRYQMKAQYDQLLRQQLRSDRKRTVTCCACYIFVLYNKCHGFEFNESESGSRLFLEYGSRFRFLLGKELHNFKFGKLIIFGGKNQYDFLDLLEAFASSRTSLQSLKRKLALQNRTFLPYFGKGG
jgi:hypothetical protein